MIFRRLSFWGLLVVLGTFGLTACEPYMSMTDQIPVQARRAAALLPENPRYVGMVDIETVVRHVGELRNQNFADSLRQTDHPLLRPFLEATEINPETDLNATYGALEKGDALSLVLFADLTPEQMDRYVAQAPSGAARATTYRGVSVYRLALGQESDTSTSDTVSVAFVDEGTLAVSTNADRVSAMVDRHRATGDGLLANSSYMALMKRVGRGSTAWLVGRDVVEAALKDSEEGGEATVENPPPVNQAGLQHALSAWSDRVLGLSEVSAIGERAGDKFGRLKSRLRDQAISLTLTDAALEGQVYLTMRDDASASSVVDVAEGAVAMLKLSGDNLDERHQDLLDEVTIEREGAIVHIRFALDRDKLRDEMRAEQRDSPVRTVDSSVRPVISSIHRMGSTTWGPLVLEILRSLQPIRR